MPIQDFFERDHRDIDALYRRALDEAKGGFAHEARRTYDAYDRGLERHIEWEEGMLFPAFEEATGVSEGGPTEVMRAEHREIRRMKAGLRARFESLEGSAGPDDPLWPISRDLVAALTEHNRKEEQILYPMCDRGVPVERREAILRRVRSEKEGAAR